MNRRHAVFLLRLLVGGLFIAASIPKLLAPQDFAVAIYRYQLLPDPAINLAAIFLPWLELVIGFSVIFLPRLRDAAALIILLLLVVFTAAIVFNLWRGIDVACGCFTTNPGATHIGWSKVALNGVFIVAAAVVWVSSWREQRGR